MRKSILFQMGIMLVISMMSVVACHALSEDNILVLYNSDYQDSVEIAQYYQSARGLDNVQFLNINGLSSVWRISQSEYETKIMNPVAYYVNQLNSIGYDIQCIVLSSGIPEGVVPQEVISNGDDSTKPDTAGFSSTWASVDSELTVLGTSGSPGAYINPYSYYQPIINSENQVTGWVATETTESFDRDLYGGMYLVTRLGGRKWTKSTSLALIDRALEAEANGISGKAFLDQSPYVGGGLDDWTDLRLADAYDLLTTVYGIEANLESTNGFYQNDPYDYTEDTFFYWGLYDGSNNMYRVDPDVEGEDNDYGHDVYNFLPGSIGAHVISWSGEWLTGMLADGITGTMYPFAEPFTIGYSDPDVLLRYYLEGYTLAEAFYASQRLLSWQMIVVGDPLLTVSYNYDYLTDTPIPEPTTILLLFAGAMALVRRFKKI